MSNSGLYDPAYEHDSCGIGLVARLDGKPQNETVRRALRALANLKHRGAAGADAESGDDAGILVQLPDQLFRDDLGARLSPPGGLWRRRVLPPARRPSPRRTGSSPADRDAEATAGSAALAAHLIE
jgi:glutamate synthase domain-containing protein 1